MVEPKSVPGCVRAAALEASFGLDLRSLFLLRVVIAVMIWVDLWIRVQTLTAHYTDAGVLPRALHQALYLDPHPGRFSLHMASGEAAFQLGLFAVLALAAFLVGVGYRTRWALLVAWLLTISLHNRNEIISTGVDPLVRLVLFWSLFLPLSSHLSLDARAGRVGKLTSQVALSWATCAFVIQLACVYWFSVVHKTHAQWRSDFTAVHYALHIDSYATSFGVWLRQFRGLTRLLTASVFYFEVFGPLLVFGVGLLSMLPRLGRLLPYQPPVRTAAVLAFMGMHAGLGLGLSLGTFSWFALLTWLALLPSEAWNALERWRARYGARLAWLEPLTAPTRVAADSRGSARRARWDWAARLPAMMALLLVLAINLRTVSPKDVGPYLDGRALTLLPNFDYVINFLRLDQHWGLFAPNPRTRDGWFVLRGTRRDGEQVDLLRPDELLTWEPPELASATYPTFRWRKYYRDLRRDGRQYTLQRPAYLAYWCREWNRAHSGSARVEALELFFMERKTLLGGGYRPTERISLAQGSCLEAAM